MLSISLLERRISSALDFQQSLNCSSRLSFSRDPQRYAKSWLVGLLVKILGNCFSLSKQNPKGHDFSPKSPERPSFCPKICKGAQQAIRLHTQRVQVPDTSGLWSQIPLRVWVLGARDLKYWVLGPSGTFGI